MKHTIRTAIAFTLASFCLGSVAGAKVVVFEIPGAASITPVAINEHGQVTGYYTNPNRDNYGFLRQPDGTLVTFSVLGRVTVYPVAISPDGVITGWYNRGASRGFVRAADGSIRTFKMPGHSTVPHGANGKGWTTGGYIKDQQPFQPFLRGPSGAKKEFSVPGANGDAAGYAVNRWRTVAGVATKSGNESIGFVRTADGTITTFGEPQKRITTEAINDDGTVAGTFLDKNGSSGFVRTIDGTINAIPPTDDGSVTASAINNSGTVVGMFSSKFLDKKTHGFFYTADGTFTAFDLPHARRTEITAINNKGVIAGIYQDRNYQFLAFVGKP